MAKKTKILFWLFGLFVFFLVLHNALYGLFKLEEPFSFTLAFLFLGAFIILAFSNMNKYLKEKKGKWQKQ